MKNLTTKAILRIVLPYVLFAGLWILWSDRLLGTLFSDPASLTRWSIYKGWAFVLVTALLLSYLLRVEFRARDRASAAFEESQQQMSRSQALLLAVTEGTSDVVYVKDTQGRYLLFNSGACHIMGKAREEVLGKDDTALFSPEDAGRLMAGERRLMETGATETFEEIITIGGGVRTFLSTKGPVCDPQGKVIGLFGIARDITERKRAEEALRQSEATLRSVFRAAPAGICIMKERVFQSANKYWCEEFGYPEESLIGKSARMFYDNDEEWNRVGEEVYGHLQAKGVASAETRMRCGDGSFREVVLTAAPIRQDDLSAGTVAIIHDITARKATERALHESERKYRELVEHANSIILRWTHEGRISFLNEFGLRFFGYSAEEIIGRHVVGTIVPVSDGGGRDLRRLMDRICADPVVFEKNVNENMRRNGERVWIAWTNKIVWDAQGRVAEILSVGTDITELKRAEDAIRELNVGLERRVAERTAELAVAKDRAEAADRLKSAFLATMSHELRTPLNSIIGFTGILLQGLAGPLNAEQRKQLAMVRDSARHLLALINDVLDISKIEAGQLEVSSEPFDLRASIAKIAGIVKPLAEKKNLALRVEVAPEIGTVVSDPRRVEQVLLNLLNNAIKFTERGGVKLTAEIAPDTLRAPYSAIYISVADTGIGIKPEDLGQLFQPFRQIDSGLTRQYEGTGLGLAICRRLAELLGGEIHAASDWGKGSVFTLTLPLKDPRES